ncbi:MAG TPA: hypothetical protein VG248_02845 [Caulobacteraceae bacterium]|jgi:hypothetical protein|nr:hypothetical protein [Caulobacteraceae bacterium]
MENPLNAILGHPAGETPPAVEIPAPEPSPQPPQIAQPPGGDEAVRPPVSQAGESEKPLDRKELHGILNATLAEREKRQAAEKRSAELEAELDKFRKVDDPTQAQPSAEQRLATQIARLEVEVEHGKAAVKSAYDWAFARCAEDPLFNSRAAALIQQIGNPYEAAIQLRKEADDLDALKTSQTQPGTGTAEPIQSPSPTPPPPRSLADQPNAGGTGRTEIPLGPGEAFKAALNR